MTFNSSPAQLANLRPAWNSETAPRSKGRPPGAKSLSEHLKALEGAPVSVLRAAMEDESDNTRMMAARIRLVGCGKLDIRLREQEILNAFAEIADRTEGKAIQVQRIQAMLGDERPVVLNKPRWEEAKRLASANTPILADDGSLVGDDGAVVVDDEPVRLPPNTVPYTHIAKPKNSAG